MINNKYLLASLLGFSRKILGQGDQTPTVILSSFFLFNIVINPVFAQSEATLPKFYQVIVNSNLDGEITQDTQLTLREAIAIINNTLPITELSDSEKNQVKLLENAQISRIEFNLNSPETTIKLIDLLPPIANPVTIDGTTNQGYDFNKYAASEKNIPTPVVAITPAENTPIFRGLTLVADNITVKGLSIYGFTVDNQTNLVTPPGDIVIAHNLKAENFIHQPSDYERTRKQRIDNNFRDPLGLSYYSDQEKTTNNIVIENNWLGISPNQEFPTVKSAFGVYVFNSINTLIKGNYITYHQGSGIITGFKAENTKIIDNIITANGMEGVPDAIRLEGIITNTKIENNLICGNDGSSVYLFKPQGNISINNNKIKFNGRRIKSSAVYLMGNNHQITNNQINYQTGPGVTIAAYPQSDRNLITNNEFANLEGLSIDIDTRRNTGVYELRIGDGINPPRSSRNRRLDTGNAAINSPKFLSNEFFVINNKVGIDGIADPGSLITIYQVNESNSNYGPLNKSIIDVYADQNGRFSADLNLKPGDTISAIATIPEYGTSEPAQNALIQSLNRQIQAESTTSSAEIPNCITPPLIAQVEPKLPSSGGLESGFTTTPEPEVIVLKVPRNIHFALDKSNISEQTAKVLDQIVTVLKQYPFIVIELSGHTDHRANLEYNQRLGNQRAISTRNYLLNKGIGAERMTIRSLGESQLKKPGDSIVDHAYNRRVEIIFRDLRSLDVILEDQDSDLQLEGR